MARQLSKKDFTGEMRSAMGTIMRKAWAKHRKKKVAKHSVTFNPHRRKTRRHRR